jgi:Putative addiction module component
MASRLRNGKRETTRKRVPEPAGFRSLSKLSRIRYLQALWDGISEKPGQLTVPKSHLRLAKERLSVYRRDRGRARPAYNVFRQVTNRTR